MATTKKPQKRQYHGDALVERDYRGPTTICLTLPPAEVLSLITALSKGAQTGGAIDLTLHPYPHKNHETRVTVTSRKTP